MALVPIRIDRTSKPPMGTPLRSDGHWSVQGLVGAYAGNEEAGTTVFDSGGIYHSTAMLYCKCGPSGIVFNGSSSAGGGAQIGAVPTLGGLSNSTVFTVFKTTATATALGGGGDALYSERASTGNDIYKIVLSNFSGVKAEFTYRNDAGTLLQQRVNADGANDGGWHTAALIKCGTAHIICYEGSTSTATYGGANTDFTNAGIKCLIGGDAVDSAATWGSGFYTGTIAVVYRYSRDLTLGQYYSLRANPWQIYEPEVVWVTVGAGGTVYSDFAIPWDMFQTVNSDLSVKWDLLNSVQSDLSIKFDMLNTVFADLAIPWDVYQTVNGDLSIVFDLRNTVQSDLQILWDSAGTVFSDFTIKWDLGNVGGRITIIGSGFRRFIG